MPRKTSAAFYPTALAVSLLVAGSALEGQTARAPAPPDTSKIDDKMISAGRNVFRGHGGCTVCHGQNLEGVVGPTLKAHQWKDAENGNYTAMIRVISNGVPGTVMVAHPNGVTDEQIIQVAAYIWAVNHGRTKP